VTLDKSRSRLTRTSRSTGQRSVSQRDIAESISIKNGIIQGRISCRRSNLVKISEPSATRYTGLMSLGQIFKSQQLRRGLLDCVQICYRVSRRQGDTLQMFNVKGEGHRVKSQKGHGVLLMYQRQNTIIRQWIGSATSNLAWR